ncbi:MAG TPA: Uma2 family endonuclease [Terriglobia bacterium]|nr:Uma2 family endonuclease [Terriglobia bacterium]
MTILLEGVETLPLPVKMPASVVEMNDDQFFYFCGLNREMQIERTAEGDILINPPSGSLTGQRSAKITTQLALWGERDGTGVVLGCSAGYMLSNRAVRSPDASWLLKSRLKRFSKEEREKFLPLCPDFVIELGSPTHLLEDLKNKMAEYIENGARLGWLLDPDTRQVLVYRHGRAVEVLNHPESVSGDPELLGFVLDLKEIWEPE